MAAWCAHTMLRIAVPTRGEAAVDQSAFHLLRGYLLAAALMGAEDFAIVGRWALDLADPKPVEVLRRHQDRVPAGWIDTMLAVRTLPDPARREVQSTLGGALMLAIRLPQDEGGGAE